MTIVIHDNLIHTIHSTSTLPSCLLSLPYTHVPVLLPGLWDCHTHLLGIKSFNFAELLTTHPATAGARLVRNVRDILLSGFTSIRDLGGYAIELSRAISEDSLPGPNIYSAGCAISQTYEMPPLPQDLTIQARVSPFVISCFWGESSSSNILIL
jgi:imidazolonepropionase-like amidohydrolase